MNDSQKRRAFSMRYCPNLHDQVVVMAESQIGKPENRSCLSSHLCHADTKAHCSHVSSVSIRSDADILREGTEFLL